MELVRLIYVSSKTEAFDYREINNLLEVARENNGKSGITGTLCFSRKFFLQYVEGSRKAVGETFARICGDTRHKDIEIIDYQQIHKREFSHWSMGYIGDTDVNEEINLKYSGNIEFEPYKMSPESALQWLLDMKFFVERGHPEHVDPLDLL